ncbi:hypothetical protein [Castellaniella sp. S9]|uniref:hypothetical protein n=1 Tax=Castellaniella sp. S9 TaxID=2993652 RepID=UPI0022B3E789|nr:hypothetical protein [Castellaniella sp. S9]
MTAYSTPYYDPPVRFREVVTRADIDALVGRGQTSLVLGERGTITDEAREHALKLGIAIQHGDRKPSAPTAPTPTVPAPAPAPVAAPAPAFARTAGGAPDRGPASAPGPTADPASPAGIIEAVAAELHARGVEPTTALIQRIVAGVNQALAGARR